MTTQLRHIVTKKAMRPASDLEQCFYCSQPIGSEHTPECVLVLRKVKVRMVVEYDIDVPARWTAEMIEFHRNDSSWCADNAINELQELSKSGCICSCTEFKYIEETGGQHFLSE